MTRLDYCHDCHEPHWPVDCPKRHYDHFMADNTKEVLSKPPLHHNDVLQHNGALHSNGVVKHCPTCTCEHRQLYSTAAERQKAYRERHKHKPS